MRLTVGSLPSSVYWRRRLVVLAVLVTATSVVWVSCGGSDEADGTKQKAGSKPSTTVSAVVSVVPAVPLLSPAGASPSGVSESTTPPAAESAPPSSNETLCADADLLVTPVPESASAQRGAGMRLTIKIRNISNRTCARDLGADQQELYLLRDSKKIYSSDACESRHGTSMKNLVPNIELAFWVPWDGTATVNGCTGRPAPAAGKYQLIGRLGTKLSDPVTVTLS